MVYTHLRPWHIQYICTMTSVYAKRLFLERFAWVLFHFLYTNQKHMWYRLNQKSALHTLTFECDPFKQAEVADILLMSYEPFEMTEWIMIRHTYAEVVRRLVFDSMWSLSVFKPYWVLSIENPLMEFTHEHTTSECTVLHALTESWLVWLELVDFDERLSALAPTRAYRTCKSWKNWYADLSTHTRYKEG